MWVESVLGVIPNGVLVGKSLPECENRLETLNLLVAFENLLKATSTLLFLYLVSVYIHVFVSNCIPLYPHINLISRLLNIYIILSLAFAYLSKVLVPSLY